MKQLTVIFCVLFLALFTSCKKVEEEPGIGVRDVCFSQSSGSLLGNGSSIFGRADCGQADDTYQLGNDNGDAHELTWDGLSGPLTGIIKIKQGATLIIVGNDGGTINSSIILEGGKISVRNSATLAGEIQITPETTTSAIAVSSGKTLTNTGPEVSIGDATLTINGQGVIANKNDFILDDKNSKMTFSDSGVTVSKVKMSGDSGGGIEVKENATVKTLTMSGTADITIANDKNLIIEKLITISGESSTYITLNINLGGGSYGMITLSQLLLGKSIDINGMTPKTTANAVLSVTANATLCFPGEISFNQTRVDQNVTLSVGDTENMSTLILKDETFNLEGKIVVTSNDTILTRSDSSHISNVEGGTYTIDTTAPSNQNTVLSTNTSITGGGSVNIVSSGDTGNTVWFAPAGTTVFSESSTMTKAGGTATSVTAPTEAGTYYLFVVDAAGNLSSASNASLIVTASAPAPISSAKTITAFSFAAVANIGLSANVTGTIDETNHTIAVTVPSDTDVTALIANFSTTGTLVSVGGDSQTSGSNANDFSSAVTYTVTAADSTTQIYTVTVTITPSSAKAITAFSFTDAANSALSADVTGAINESSHTIAVTVPFGTDATALKATFVTTGSSVSIGGTSQTSGSIANDFSSAVTYTVTAVDSTTQDYVVTVTVTLSSAKTITAFSFTDAGNAALSADVTGAINESNHTIAVTVPFGTDVTALKATFTTTGSPVSIGGTSQTSGTTANDFSSAVTYTVTAADSTTQDYTVTVTITPGKAITAFSFTDTANIALSADITGTINESNHTIAVTVPSGTNVTALIANFTTIGSSVSIGGTSQTSGTTANDFSSSVTYTVTATDTATQDFVVTVTIGAKLPDTGQTTSYTATFGEDHDYTINAPSYTNNNNGTVTDNNTNLLWQQSDDNSTKNWDSAISYCQNLSLGGYSDWRLPNVKELQSIVDYGRFNPAVNTDIFPGMYSSYYYWSSTTDANDTSNAWYVYLNFGLMYSYNKSDNYYVRCVRGGSELAIWSLDFSAVGSDAIVHQSTGLIWQREDDNATKNWESALSYCEGLSLDGHNDWRLPNAKELPTIVDYSKYNPSINTTVFPNTNSLRYWSSTTNVNDTSIASYVDFNNGDMSYFYKSSNYYVRCVRGGQ